MHIDAPPHTFTNFDREQEAAEDVARSMSRLRFACERAKIALSDGVPDAKIEVDSFNKDRSLDFIFDSKEFKEISRNLFRKCEVAIRQCIKDANLGEGAVGKVIAVGGSAKLPGMKILLAALYKRKAVEHRVLVPYDAVVRGAAIHAAILSANVVINKICRDSVLDVTPFDIAIKSSSEMKSLIKRNTTLPTIANHVFTTSAQGQKTAEIRVYEQGWNENYNFLGMFKVSNLLPAPAYCRQVTATFKIDQDGVLDGSALEILNTSDNPGFRCPVTIEKGMLTPEEIKAFKNRAAGI